MQNKSRSLCGVVLRLRFRGPPLFSSQGPIHTGCESRFAANLHANPLMLLATCVNTPIYCSVFHNVHALVARCSASCVNGAQRPGFTKLQQALHDPISISEISYSSQLRTIWTKTKRFLSSSYKEHWRIQGALGPGPPCPHFFQIMQFSGNFEQSLGSGPPWGQNSTGAPWPKSWIRPWRDLHNSKTGQLEKQIGIRLGVCRWVLKLKHSFTMITSTLCILGPTRPSPYTEVSKNYFTDVQNGE